jgi:hypothetical protein
MGEDHKHITTLDEDSVALAAIQGLNPKLDDRLQVRHGSQIVHRLELRRSLKISMPTPENILFGSAASKLLQGNLGDSSRLLTEFGDRSGLPKVGFSQRAGDQQISMRLTLGIERLAIGISAEAKTQGVIAQHSSFD